MNQKLDTLRAYVNAWNLPVDELDSTLRQLVSAEVSYVDPFTELIVGVDALLTVMRRVGDAFPGMSHHIVDSLIVFGIHGSYRWSARFPDGNEIEGWDYVSFDSADRLQQIISFTNKQDWMQATG